MGMHQWLALLTIYLVQSFFAIALPQRHSHSSELHGAQFIGTPPAQDYRTFSLNIPFRDKSVQFYIHFLPRHQRMALQTRKILFQYAPLIHSSLESVPKTPVHFIIAPLNLEANGQARVFPRNQVLLFDYPPAENSGLSFANNWLENLVVHEYFHIVSLDMTGSWVNVLRSIFGSYVKPNGVAPQWWTEGSAVWMEKKILGSGRLYHPVLQKHVNSLLRAKRSEGLCSHLDCLDSPGHYPHTSSAYWIGADFVDFIEGRYPGTVGCIYQRSSSTPPFFLNHIAEKCTGLSFSQWWDVYLSEKKSNKDTTFDWAADWQAGRAATRDLETTVRRDNRHSGPWRLYDQELVVRKEGNPHLKRKFSLPIEKLYECDFSQTFICLSAWEWHKGIAQRKTFRFNPESGELRPFDFLGPDYIFFDSQEKREPEYSAFFLSYRDSSWQLTRNDKLMWNSDQLKQILSPRIRRKENAEEYELIFFNRHDDERQERISLPAEKKSAPTANKLQASSQSYQPFSYLVPQYFMLNYNNARNLQQVSLFGHIDDPIAQLRLDFALDYYADLDDEREKSSFVPQAKLQYQTGLWQYGFDVERQYGAGPAQRNLIDEQNTTARLFRNLFTGPWNIGVGGLLRFNETDDLFSRRRSFQYWAQASSTWLTLNQRSWLQSASTDLLLGHQKTEGFDGFESMLVRQTARSSWNPSMQTSLDLAYGVQWKEGLQQGVLYGGGVSSFFTGNFFFPSYSLGYGDLLGNEVFTSRLAQRFVIARPYRGSGLLPFQIQELSFKGGGEFAFADFSVQNREFVRERGRTSVFAGVELQARLFYRVPVTFEIVASELLETDSSTQALFLVQTNIYQF